MDGLQRYPVVERVSVVKKGVEPTTGLEDAADFSEGLRHVRDVMQDAIRVDDIEVIVRKGKCLGITDSHVRIKPVRREMRFRAIEVFRRDVDADVLGAIREEFVGVK